MTCKDDGLTQVNVILNASAFPRENTADATLLFRPFCNFKIDELLFGDFRPCRNPMCSWLLFMLGGQEVFMLLGTSNAFFGTGSGGGERSVNGRGENWVSVRVKR
jgi:hypothetical protein